MVPLSAFFTMIVLSRNRSFNACFSLGDRLSFGLLKGMFASSNFTSSRCSVCPYLVFPYLEVNMCLAIEDTILYVGLKLLCC